MAETRRLSTPARILLTTIQLILSHSNFEITAPKPKGDSFHASENPTFYRQKSQYMRLLQELHVDGYHLQVLWATSVPTYIELEGNWRQVDIY